MREVRRNSPRVNVSEKQNRKYYVPRTSEVTHEVRDSQEESREAHPEMRDSSNLHVVSRLESRF